MCCCFARPASAWANSFGKLRGVHRWREVNEQAPAIESRSCAETDALDEIFVVPDEHKRRAGDDAPAVGLEPNRHIIVSAEDVQRCRSECRPLGVALPAKVFAPLNDARIHANRRVVDEHPIVDAPRIDACDTAARDRFDRLGQIDGNLKIFREMVQRPEWKHAERRWSASQRRRDGADRSVAAAGDDGFGVLVQCGVHRFRHLTDGGELCHANVHALSVKQSHQLLNEVWIATRTADRIQNDREQGAG